MQLGFSHDVDVPPPDGHHLRDAPADRDQGQRHRQAAGRRDRRPHPPDPPARSPTRARACATPARRSAARKARRSSHGRSSISNPPSAAPRRTRTRLKTLAGGRPRLSVFRSSKNIYAQVIDDAGGVTLAHASSLEGGKERPKGADKDAAARVGKLVAERAIDKGRQGRGLRPRRLYLSRPRQGAGRRRARSRPELLRNGSEHGSRRTTARRPAGSARRPSPEERADSDIVEKLVHINRVAATVKGGRRFSFAALMVVGDQKGRVGYGHGKAREVPEAIRKATEEAKKSMIRVPLRESRTLHHDGRGRHGAGKVMLRAAPGRHRRHRRRPDARGAGDARRAGRGRQVDRLVQPLQHGARDLRCAEAAGLASAGRRQARQEGRRHLGRGRRRAEAEV